LTCFFQGGPTSNSPFLCELIHGLRRLHPHDPITS
jgi:hypothetical protein